MVVLVHSAGVVAPESNALKYITSSGARGVQLFYIASALTLCMSWRSRSVLEIAPQRNFFIRRFFRIAPMFYVATIFYVLLYGLAPRYWAPNGVDWWFIPVTMLFLHGFHPETITSVVPGGWSIAVEMNFYILLPFLLRHISTAQRAALFFMLTILLFAVQRFSVQYLLEPLYPPAQKYLVQSFEYLNFLGQLPVFAIGILAYHVFFDKYLKKRALPLCWIAIFGSIGLYILIPAPVVYRVLNNHIVLSIGFAAVALTLADFPWRIIVNPVVILFGKLSFSMYLTHFAVLHFFSRLHVPQYYVAQADVASILHFVSVVAVASLISYGFYRLIEVKGIAMGKRVIDKLERRDSQWSSKGGLRPIAPVERHQVR